MKKVVKNFLISASILSADFAFLGDEVTNVLHAGADLIHFDVMDNHYVPNLTFGPLVCKSLRNYGIKNPIDIHLMANPVDQLIYKFADVGASSIAVHFESSDKIRCTLNLIKKLGCKASLVLNPSTSLDCLKYVIDILDSILIMSVTPGYSGQTFLSHSLKKIIQARKIIDDINPNILLGVDGGININNINKIADAGADIFVIGSGIFNKKNYKIIIDKIRQKLCK